MPALENKGTNSAEGFCIQTKSSKLRNQRESLRAVVASPWQFLGRRQSRAQEVVVQASGNGTGKGSDGRQEERKRKGNIVRALFFFYVRPPMRKKKASSWYDPSSKFLRSD
jgi:hypothetical protein